MDHETIKLLKWIKIHIMTNLSKFYEGRGGIDSVLYWEMKFEEY
jgi:hypothetical protein